MKLNEVVDKYIQLRDKKAAMKKKFDEDVKPVTDAMDQIEAVLLKTFDAAGLDSAKTEKGTAYVSTRTSASVADKESFLEFVKRTGEWPLIEVRAAKAAIETFKDENQDLPPGINWNEERVVNVRRS
jgi:hypothetical protein